MKEPLEKLDFGVCDSLTFSWDGGGSQRETDPVSLAPCLTEKPLRRRQQQQSWRFKAFSVPLSLSLSFFFSLSDPLFLISKYLLKSQDVKIPWRFGTGTDDLILCAAHMSVHTKPGVDATTHMHAGFVLAVTRWQLEGGTNKNSSRCLHSSPLSCFHLVLSNLCSTLPSPLQPSSLIPKCLHPSTPISLLAPDRLGYKQTTSTEIIFSYSQHISGILGCIITKPF